MARFHRPTALLLGDRLWRSPLIVTGAGTPRILAAEQQELFPPAAAIDEAEGELWTAAPVLAHAHYESWDAPSQDWPRHSFSAWVQALLHWRESGAGRSPAASAHACRNALRESGCGAVLIHGSDQLCSHAPESGPPLERPLPEIFAPDPSSAQAWVEEALEFPFGWALHAPYSVSEPLARALLRRPRRRGQLRSIHLGEHPEERRLLATGDGPLASLFAQRARPLKTGRWPSPVDWLLDMADGRSQGLLAVHCGDLSASEIQRLVASGGRPVWCPGTHLFFDRPRPAFFDAGIQAPALGCDSRASNDRMDPLHEVRLARRLLPEYGPCNWWRALTETGAHDLDLSRGISSPWARSLPILRFSDPDLYDVGAVCDYLTAADGPRPLGPVRFLP